MYHSKRHFLALAAAGIITASYPALAGQGAGPPALAQLFGGPFTLVDHNGKTRRNTDFRGRFILIYFGYTYCPDICPTNLQHMADALAQLGRRANAIVPIFISIDPGRDTPQVLKDYVANFNDRFIGLTGSQEQVRAVAKAYRVHRRMVLEKGEQDRTNYLVDHSSITYLIGPDGKFLTLFPHNTTGAEMARRLKTYLPAPPA